MTTYSMIEVVVNSNLMHDENPYLLSFHMSPLHD